MISAREAAEKIVPHTAFGMGCEADPEVVKRLFQASEQSRRRLVDEATAVIQAAIDAAKAEA